MSIGVDFLSKLCRMGCDSVSIAVEFVSNWCRMGLIPNLVVSKLVSGLDRCLAPLPTSSVAMASAVGLSDGEQQAVIVGCKHMVATGPKSYLAARQVSKWTSGGSSGLESIDGETLVRLYMSIREVAGDGAKITPHMLKQLYHNMERSSSLTRELWLLPTENLVPERLQPFFVPHHSIQEWPLDVDPEGVVVYDSAVPQFELGRHVVEFSVPHNNSKSPCF